MKRTALPLIIFALANIPQIAAAHPGHSDFNALAPQHLTAIDGMLHSLIALPSLLLAVALGVLLAKSTLRFRDGLSLVAPASSCAIASYHLDGTAPMASQMLFVTGAALMGWLVCQTTRVLVQALIRRFATHSAAC